MSFLYINKNFFYLNRVLNIYSNYIDLYRLTNKFCNFYNNSDHCGRVYNEKLWAVLESGLSLE